jgi:hypothetical protein
MNQNNRMTRLYERLAAFGIDRKYVANVALPPGWNDREAVNPAVYSQALSILSRNLNLDLRTLQADDARLAWNDCGPALFKHNQDLGEADIEQVRCLAIGAARIACQALSLPVAALPVTGIEMRKAILNMGKHYVSLEDLLDHCWNSGIPVLHIARFPAHTRKPDALVSRFQDRPAIVITKQHAYSAWLLFILAHEAGHIALGHLGGGGILVDTKVDASDSDLQEEQANRFALELLTGKPDIQYTAPNSLTAEALAERARIVCQRDGVDPGFVALNYARGKGRSAVGNAALTLIQPDVDPIAAIRSRMCERLDWQSIPRDSRHFLRRITETD